MKTLEISQLLQKRFALSDISVIYQSNHWSVCSHENGRVYNGFLLIESGVAEFRWRDTSAKVSEGALIYLPKGSQHKVFAKERSLNFYRINFTVTDLSDMENVVFSSEPVVISENAPKTLFSLCEQMRKSSLAQKGAFKNISALAELLDYVRHTMKKSDGRRISSAIYYVENHYTEDIQISHLAKISFLSEAHLFRLFKKEIGMSPVEYKNSLRIKKAEELLLDVECSINEISNLVGFENACYFSRVFKKLTGLSPLEYRNKYV